MGIHGRILVPHLSEQIALEEHLCRLIEQQIGDINDDAFSDAKALLSKVVSTLEDQFAPLNESLDELEEEVSSIRSKEVASAANGALVESRTLGQISKALRDDYSALVHITTSNTLLHATALALDCQNVATLALKNLRNLAPLVVQIGELMPEVVARELRSEFPKIDQAIAKTALHNTRAAWRRER